MSKQSLVITVVIVGLGLISCSNTQTSSTNSQTSQPSMAAAAMPPSQSRPVLDPRTDPNNSLFKRGTYFDFDKAEIKSQYKSILAAHAKYLSEHPASHVTIEGNCDERGSRKYNIKLGMKRAIAVKSALVRQGAKESQIKVISYGKDKPESRGHNEQSWAANRRADIQYADLVQTSFLNNTRYLSSINQ